MKPRKHANKHENLDIDIPVSEINQYDQTGPPPQEPESPGINFASFKSKRLVTRHPVAKRPSAKTSASHPTIRREIRPKPEYHPRNKEQSGRRQRSPPVSENVGYGT